MRITSYEVVRRAIEFKGPPRLPVRFEVLNLNDVHDLVWNQFRPFEYSGKTPAKDEWGCTWERTDVQNMGQVKGHPLADIKNLKSFAWPDPNDPRFYEGMEKQLTGSEGKYVLTGIFMLLFERIHALRGFENTLADLMLHKDTFETIATAVVEFDLGVIRNLAQRFDGKIHGFAITDDWGTENALIISPDLWNEQFKPRYKSIFDEIHKNGWHVWMHSCGRINKILDGLIDVGLDVVNLQQPQVLDVEEIGRNFSGRICFESLCDIQKTLPFGGEKEIREEAQLLLNSWAHENGGFILSDYSLGDDIGVSIEKKKIMLDAFLDADPWRHK